MEGPDHSATEVMASGSLLAGRFAVLERLGSGASSEVYLVEDRLLPGYPRAALKLLMQKGSEQRWVERFKREVQLLQELAHPNIVTVFDIGFTAASAASPPCYFIVMEYIEGRTLRDMLNEKPLPFPEALLLFKQLLQALAHAHEKGVIHRDIKPENILISADGMLKLTDFGVAKRTGSNENGAATPASSGKGSDQLTTLGEVVGTYAYMSPEQLRGEPADMRSELYAAALVGFEMVTGRRPFDGPNEYETLCRRQAETVPRIDSGLAPRWFSELLVNATAVRPEDRIVSIDAFLFELNQAVTEPDFTHSLRSVKGRAKRGLKVLAMVTGALLVLNGVRFWQGESVLANACALLLAAEGYTGPLSIPRYLLGLSEETTKNFLYLAAGHANYRVAERLLREGADPNVHNQIGEYSLDIAVKKQDAKMVKLLLAYKARFRHPEHMGLWSEIIKLPKEILRDLIAHDILATIPEDWDAGFLLGASLFGSTDDIDMVLSSRLGETDALEKSGIVIAGIVAELNKNSLLMKNYRHLLAHPRITRKAWPRFGAAALQISIRNGNWKIAEELLDKGAGEPGDIRFMAQRLIDVRDERLLRKTIRARLSTNGDELEQVFTYAIQVRPELLRAIVEEAATPNRQGNNSSYLAIAMLHRKADVVTMLMAMPGIDIYQYEPGRESLLAWTIAAGVTFATEMLMERYQPPIVMSGPDWNIPISAVYQAPYEIVAKLIEKFGIDLETVSSNGELMLFMSIFNPDTRVFERLLLDEGARRCMEGRWRWLEKEMERAGRADLIAIYRDLVGTAVERGVV